MVTLAAALAALVAGSIVSPFAAAPPADWLAKVDAADALWSADDGALPFRSLAGLGNGMLGGLASGSRIYMAGVFSGALRASVATDLLSTRLSGSATAPLTPLGALLDLRQATYSRRYTGAMPSGGTAGGYTVEQKFYFHRAVPSLLVMEVGVTIPCGCPQRGNLTLLVSHDRPNSTDVQDPDPETVAFTHRSLVNGANVSIGSTIHPEGGALPGKAPVLQVVMIATEVHTPLVHFIFRNYK